VTKPSSRALGGASAVGVAVASALAHPMLGWVFAGVTAAAIAIVAVVILAPSTEDRPFDRLMRFLGLLLNRSPARFLPQTSHQRPRQQRPKPLGPKPLRRAPGTDPQPVPAAIRPAPGLVASSGDDPAAGRQVADRELDPGDAE
jgi:hypothetical protein